MKIHFGTLGKLGRLLVLLLGLAMAPAASATFHTYRIEQIYSNGDGTIQFVVLKESLGDDGQEFWSSHAITSTPFGSMSNVFVFPNNLPGDATAATHVLVATAGFAALNLVTPDYVVPNHFLSTAKGSINFADVDQVSYASLPTDGTHAIDRKGNVIQNVATNFAGASATVAAAPSFAITPGITGAWYDAQQSGHGLFLEVLPPNNLLAFWFTFSPDGTQQSWFGGVGTYSGNTATVQPALTTGGRWIPNFDASKVVNNAWGTLTFTFTDCNTGRVDFTSTYPGYGSNHMTLTRLTMPAGLTCP